MVKRLDKWCDNIWIYVMCVLGTATAIYLVLNWSELPLGAKGGAFVAIIMPLHVIEEWKLPGGLHYIYNVIFGSRKMGAKYLDRYPMSRLTDMRRCSEFSVRAPSVRKSVISRFSEPEAGT